MPRRGRLVFVFGTPKLVKENPWARYGVSKKSHYIATPVPWMFDRTKLSAAQLAAIRAFTDTVAAVANEIRSDGTFTTLVKRVREVGRRLAGKTYGGKPKVVPKYASESYRSALIAKGYVSR